MLGRSLRRGRTRSDEEQRRFQEEQQARVSAEAEQRASYQAYQAEQRRVQEEQQARNQAAQAEQQARYQAAQEEQRRGQEEQRRVQAAQAEQRPIQAEQGRAQAAQRRAQAEQLVGRGRTRSERDLAPRPVDDAAGLLDRMIDAQEDVRERAADNPFTPLESFTGTYRDRPSSTYTRQDYADQATDFARLAEPNREAIDARMVEDVGQFEAPDLLDSLGYMGSQRPGEFTPVEGGPQTAAEADAAYADRMAQMQADMARRAEVTRDGSLLGDVGLGLAAAAVPGLGPSLGLGLAGSSLFGAATGSALTRAQGGDVLEGALLGGLSGAGASLAAGGGGEAIQGVIEDVADATGLANEQVIELAESVAQGADAEDIAASIISGNIQGQLPEEIVIDDVFREGTSTIPSEALGGFVDLAVDAAFGEDIGASDIAGATLEFFDQGGDLGFLAPTVPSVGDLFPEFDLDLATPDIISDIGDAIGSIDIPPIDIDIPPIDIDIPLPPAPDLQFDGLDVSESIDLPPDPQLSESIDLPPDPQFSESVDLPASPEPVTVPEAPELPSVDTPDLSLPDVPGLAVRGPQVLRAPFEAQSGPLFAYTPFYIYRKGMFS